jgi:LacI family transcriptional regulator
MTAIGVMRQAYEQNIRVPESLSVVGFDDIRLAEFTTPPLTTVQMSQKELAKIAFRALLNEIEGDPPLHERHEYELTTSLVLRRSTALAPIGGTATPPKGSGRSRARNASATLPH